MRFFENPEKVNVSALLVFPLLLLHSRALYITGAPVYGEALQVSLEIAPGVPA